MIQETTDKAASVSMVQTLREIRDGISVEIKDMTFAEERSYLDNLLKREKTSEIKKQANEKNTPASA